MSRYRVVQRAVNEFDVEELRFGLFWFDWPIGFNTLEKAIKFINDLQEDEKGKMNRVVYETNTFKINQPNIQQLPKEK